MYIYVNIFVYIYIYIQTYISIYTYIYEYGNGFTHAYIYLYLYLYLIYKYIAVSQSFWRNCSHGALGLTRVGHLPGRPCTHDHSTRIQLHSKACDEGSCFNDQTLPACRLVVS